MRRVHLQGYIAAVKAGVGSIMPSYSSWNGVKSIEISINAGMDMVMVPERYQSFYANLLQLVQEGRVPMSRIDDAVRRILRVKFALGLMDSQRSQLADRRLHNTFGSAAHRRVDREAVRQSLVLLKNENKILPLAKTAARIHVAGASAEDIGNQCGGWTIDWQGKSGEVTPGGTTVLGAIKQAVGRNTTVTFTKDGSGAAGATVGVVVIGERPYAEMFGDRASLSLQEEDIAAVNNMKASGIPVVVILFSGRPMIIGDVLDKADAFVAAWLPGTEGAGITDVLFGDFKPSGKLCYAWPRSMEQFPRAKNTDPLFPFGYGLTY